MIFASLLTPYALLLLPIIYYLLPYLRNNALRKIPGPPLAAFSNLWLLYQCKRGRRSLAVDEAHERYGPLVRIQPNHVSVADPEAIPVIYSMTGGWLKSDYYDAFVSIQRGLFNTRDRAEHTRKRKTISHTFSAKSIGQFEQYMTSNLEELVTQWNRLSDDAVKSGKEWAEMNCLHWFNYLAFDIIGDLAFGAPFGMLPKGADVAEVQLSPNTPTTHAPAIEVLNRRGEVCSTLGCLPALKPYAKYLPDPFFHKGISAVESLAGIATARVNSRLDAEEKGGEEKSGRGRKDLLARLMEGRDENGERLGREELTAEALTQLIAGSDTTSNTLTAMVRWCAGTEGVWGRLRGESDAAVEDGTVIPTYECVKDLPYLDAVLRETLRIHSTSSLGLPRLVPPSNPVTLLSHTFPPLTTLSVPTYTIHHSPIIWGPDAHDFRPERWERVTEKQRQSFIPFSVGPRACVGRNVAEMELKLVMAVVVRGFDVLIDEGGGGWEEGMREGFLRKPGGLEVKVRRRVRGSKIGDGAAAVDAEGQDADISR